jgi:hypothetical protein
MGMAHVLYAYEDGIRGSKDPGGNRAKYVQALGEALLNLCLSPVYERTEKGPARVTDAAILNHESCLNWVDEIHSEQERLYMWYGNCLRSVADLADEELNRAKQLLDEETNRRSGRGSAAPGT